MEGFEEELQRPEAESTELRPAKRMRLDTDDDERENVPTQLSVDLNCLGDGVVAVADSDSPLPEPPGSPLPPYGERPWEAFRAERFGRSSESRVGTAPAGRVASPPALSNPKMRAIFGQQRFDSDAQDGDDQHLGDDDDGEGEDEDGAPISQRPGAAEDLEAERPPRADPDEDGETVGDDQSVTERNCASATQERTLSGLSDGGSATDEIDYSTITGSGAEPTMAAVALLQERVAALEKANAALQAENDEFRKKTATLSPALYQVDAPKEVRKMRLGRTASIATRNELIKLSRAPGSPIPNDEREIAFMTRMDELVRPGRLEQENSFLYSTAFADHFISLCERVGRILEREKRVLELSSPMYVFGDFHGNMHDLQFFAEHVWPMGMRLTAGKFLFLGDYVDRGAHGLELLAYLLTQKVLMPDKIFLIRGNHETRSVNGWEAFYGDGSFIHQCKARFGQDKGFDVWEQCNELVFDRLPLAAIVDESIFCVHGGIPCPTHKAGDQDTRIDDIRGIPCPIDIQPPPPEGDDNPQNALAFSLLWADPADQDQEGFLVNSVDGFGESARGGGTVVFGSKAVHEFLDRHNLDYILRAHEATANGVAVCKSAKVLTVFSTSKDHNCGGDAKCGCFLVDRRKIQAITRSGEYNDGVLASHSLRPAGGLRYSIGRHAASPLSQGFRAPRAEGQENELASHRLSLDRADLFAGHDALDCFADAPRAGHRGDADDTQLPLHGHYIRL